MRLIVIKPFRDQAGGKQRKVDEIVDILDESEAERLVKEGYAEKADDEAPEDDDDAET